MLISDYLYIILFAPVSYNRRFMSDLFARDLDSISLLPVSLLLYLNALLHVLLTPRRAHSLQKAPALFWLARGL